MPDVCRYSISEKEALFHLSAAGVNQNSLHIQIKTAMFAAT